MRPPLFVLNVGRSGSSSLAYSFRLHHEPDGPYTDIDMIRRRLKWRRRLLSGWSLYGETANTHRMHIEALKEAFPGARFIHLVRNGRDVVRSFLDTRFYLGDDDTRYGRNYTIPVTGFKDMDRFEKLCWHWTYWNEQIQLYTHSRLRLEDMAPLLPVKNKGHGERVTLSPSREQVFWEVCGPLMQEYGYE